MKFIKKARINMSKYGYLFSRVVTQQINNNKLVDFDVASNKKTTRRINEIPDQNINSYVVEPKSTSRQQEPPKIITESSSNLVKINTLQDHITLVVPETDHHQSSTISPMSSSTPSVVSPVRNAEPDNYFVESTSYNISSQCQQQMQLLYDMCPVINKNYLNTQALSNVFDLLNTQQYEKMNEYSQRLKPQQLFRCPKDFRSKRQKCCGVYYDLLSDAWNLIERWFTIE